MAPEFFYFDLGNVLLKFDHRLACSQMGELVGHTADKVWDILFASGMELRYNAGEMDDRGFYELFCGEAGSQPDYAKLLLAASEIFEVNWSIAPVVAQLRLAGHRMGILSNTCPSHWNYCQKYSILQSFDVHALSYELGAVKPDPKIFERAAKLVGVAPEKIFFVDDIEKNVAGALAAGFDAVLYTDTPALVAALRERGVKFNY